MLRAGQARRLNGSSPESAMPAPKVTSRRERSSRLGKKRMVSSTMVSMAHPQSISIAFVSSCLPRRTARAGTRWPRLPSRRHQCSVRKRNGLRATASGCTVSALFWRTLVHSAATAAGSKPIRRTTPSRKTRSPRHCTPASSNFWACSQSSGPLQNHNLGHRQELRVAYSRNFGLTRPLRLKRSGSYRR